MRNIYYLLSVLLITTNLNAHVGHDSLRRKIDKDLQTLTNQEKVEFLVKEAKSNLQTDHIFALHLSNRAMKIADSTSDRKGQIEALLSLGHNYFTITNYDTAMVYYEKALKLSIEENDSLGMLSSMTNMGLVHDMWAEFDKAIKYFITSREIAERLNRSEEVAHSYIRIGKIFRIQEAYDSSLANFLKAFKILSKDNDKIELASYYLEIGVLFRNLKRYDQALSNFQNALEHFLEANDKKQAARVYGYIGLIYFDQKEYTTSLEYHKKAAELRKQISDREGLGISLNNYGKIYLRLGEYNKALVNFNAALNIRRKSGNVYGIAETNARIAEVYSMMGNSQMALKHINISVKISERHDIINLIKENYFFLSKIYENLGQNKKALKYYKKYSQYKENLLNTGTSKKIADLQMQLESEAQLKRISTLTKENEIHELMVSQERQIRIYLIIFISFLLIAASLIYYLYKTNKKTTEFLYMVINSLSQPFYVINANTFDIELANKAAKEENGRETANRKCYQVIHKINEPCSTDEVGCPINEIRNNGEKVVREYKFIDKNGVKYVEIYAYSIFDSKGNFEKIIEYHLDITDRKIAEKRVERYVDELKYSNDLSEKKAEELERLNISLIKSKAELKRINSTKDKFFSIISHDLKSPFNALLGFSEYLIKENDVLTKEEIGEFSQSINNTARRIYDLLENLLNWSRLQSEQIAFNPDRFDLFTCGERVVTLLSASAQRKKITIDNKILHNTFVYADENMIETVLRNLLSNAIKFTHQNGQIELEASQGMGVINIAVKDNGLGIDKETQRRLFQFEYHHTTLGTAKEQGTGLGLVMCDELVRKNGGSIWIESAVGKGSKFIFSLPAKV